MLLLTAAFFLNHSFAGLEHWDQSQDVHTPAALGLKALMHGAQDAQLHVPLSLLHVSGGSRLFA